MLKWFCDICDTEIKTRLASDYSAQSITDKNIVIELKGKTDVCKDCEPKLWTRALTIINEHITTLEKKHTP